MEKDPVCGMEVDEKSEFNSTFNSKTYHFCSANCKETFDKNPQQFAT